MTQLLHNLSEYGESDYYPYHMPGHKRKSLGDMPENILKIDITEIDGFDNLHQPEGILADAQMQANDIYHAEETFFLINGSTSGILSAISAVAEPGDRLLITRGCHKSVYHAAYLRQLKLSYVYSEKITGYDLLEAVTSEAVKSALETQPDIKAVLIVSPTYEGRMADVAAIAEVAHEKGIPLIVDEAHGAHLGMDDKFAQNSCVAGADLVIHSVHKTLPAMTQTALIHVNGNLVDRDRLKRFLHIYQSSSPSYVLMSSICDSMEIVQNKGKVLFENFYENYCQLLDHLSDCKCLKFLPMQDIREKKQDVGKLVIFSNVPSVSGQWIYDELRNHYHLQCEMAQGSYCLAMFTIADDAEAYIRMEKALIAIDTDLQITFCDCDIEDANEGINSLNLQEIPVAKYTLNEAWDKPSKWVLLKDAANCAVAEFVNLYPPGVPILVPGEVLTENFIEMLTVYKEKGLNLQGIDIRSDGDYIKIVE